MGIKWHGFVATDTIKNTALRPKYATMLHVAKAGRDLRVYAELPGKPHRGWLGTLVSRNMPKSVSSERPELDALGD